MKRPGGEELKFRAASILGRGLLEALFATVRISAHGEEHLRRAKEEHDGVLYVLWHDQLLPLVRYHRNRGVVVLVSEHADGEYLTRVLLRQGFGAVRGSSTRGGAKGLRGLVRAARDGRDLAVTPDGPRGPRHRFKEGAVVAAQMTGLPMLPVVAAASRSWRFDSWDRFVVPRPFSRVQVRYAPCVPVERGASPDERRAMADRMEETLGRLTREARAAVGDRETEATGATVG